MIENVRGIKAIRRSIRLCRGMWWSVFGTLLLASLITGVFSIVVTIVSLVIVSVSHDSTVAVNIGDFFTRTISLACLLYTSRCV